MVVCTLQRPAGSFCVNYFDAVYLGLGSGNLGFKALLMVCILLYEVN